MIWKTDELPDIGALNAMSQNSMVSGLGIEVTGVGEDSISARMPVDHRHVQPMRLLHGGASVVLAETLGSIAASLCVDSAEQTCLGLDINANHLRSVREGGAVVATAVPIHLGGRTQVWEIRIADEADGRLVCVSRLTLAVVGRRRSAS